MKTSVALVGFMGTGKTAAGKILAEKLGKEFIELDSLIEKKAGRKIPQIFQEKGEIGFRELEIEAVKEIAGRENAVVACGGGVVLNKINVDRLGKGYIIVYLVATPQVILKRVSGDKNERPLLAVADRLVEIRELMRFRKPFYERAADIKINTSRLNTEAVALKILEELKENGSYGQ